MKSFKQIKIILANVTLMCAGYIAFNQNTLIQANTNLNVTNTSNSNQNAVNTNYSIKANLKYRRGLMIDSARFYNSPTILKKYINLIVKEKGNYIQLHLTDDQNFGIENEYLGQMTNKNSYQKNGIYYSSITHKPFLTKTQLQDVINYGHNKNIEIVLDIDVPGHTKALIKLAKNNNLNIPIKDNELNYRDSNAINFIKNIYQEYFSILPTGSVISTGNDESSIYSNNDRLKVAKFENQLNEYLNQNGYLMQIWNDAVQKKNIKKYDKNIIINYWSITGDVSNKQNIKDNIKDRTGLTTINKDGFKSINSNAQTGYIMANDLNTTNKKTLKTEYAYWKDQISEWSPKIWNISTDTNTDNKTKSKNNVGAAISIWGDDKKSDNAKRVYHNSIPYIKHFFKKAK